MTNHDGKVKAAQSILSRCGMDKGLELLRTLEIPEDIITSAEAAERAYIRRCFALTLERLGYNED